ncbi:DNA polymerase III subunit gamma/tau [uncultured Slackia sp.]|uniref:DNA polymerase III subunit gamma/tau n=1 Tax=uncultured Slackia sp. TaxID=665903 RepID=UPI0025EBF591|nr:DNA polymerase III subunit gamma/tau [uncultured Slackia sp.]
MSEALYRKYRPQTFEDVVGQTHIERTLKNAIEQDKVGHAYMFCGPRGTGKTTTARLLAKALLCEKGPTPAPDGTCEQCLAIAEGNHPDVYELDAASRTGVDNVREEIIGRVQYAPTRGRYKVYIIDEVHMLSIAAFNALLKTLEEPPSHVVFIMCTTDPQKVPETIQSRCQRFDFHRLSNEEIIARLGAVCTAEDVQFEGDALDLVAHRAQGGMRDALTMLEQLIAFGDGNVTMEVANDVLGSLDVDDMSGIVRSIATRDAAACFTWVSEYVETGADLARFVRDLAAYVRDLYVLSLTDGAVAVNAPQSSLPRMSGEAQMFGIDRLAYILRVLGDLNTELRTSTNPRLSFEIGLTRMVRPQSDLTLESLAARVEVLERALAQGAVAAPAAAQPAAVAQQPASVPPAANAGYRQSAAAPAAAVQPAVAPSPAQAQPIATQPAAPVSHAQASQFQRPMPRPAQTQSAAQPASQGAAMVDKAAEFRAQLERRRAQRTVLPQTQPQPQGFAPQTQPAVPARAAAPAAAPVAPASATATPAAPAVASAAPAVASSDVKAKLSNPAALQRGWQTALADLKRQRAAYGALLLSARIVAEPDASGIAIEFSPENSFAFSAAQKPDITAAIESALSASFGGPVPFRVTQGSAAGGTASVASAPAPAPAAPAAPVAAARRAQQSAGTQAPSTGPSRQAPQAAAAPPWDDDVVPYTDADIAAYMPEEEQPPFTEPDASLTVGAPSHREAASQASEPAAFANPAKDNPFAGRKMPEGIGRGVPAQPEAVAQASEPAASSSSGQASKAEPEGAPAKKRKTAADKLAEAVAEFGDAMLVVGPEPVDPFPVALELGFDSAPDPKKKAKGMVKPKGWPMPQDAKLLEGRDLDALREGCDDGQEGETPSSDSWSSAQFAQPASVAAAEPEPQFAPVAEPEFPAEPPAPIPAPPSRPNPFANRAMPQGIGGGQSSHEPAEYANASSGSSGEMSVEEIFASFGVNMSKVTEER